MDCGPTCLRMVAKYYGKNCSRETLQRISNFNKEGVSLLGISDAGEKIGFRTFGVQLNYEQMMEEAVVPSILHWKNQHFVVMLPVRHPKRAKHIRIADPSKGIIKYTATEFKQLWTSSVNEEGERIGTVLLLEPSPEFHESEESEKKTFAWHFLFKYLKNGFGPIFNIIAALIVISLLQLLLPFLTQSIVDVGINGQNVSFIIVVLLAQLMLIFSRTIVDFIRSRLSLNLAIRVSISILSDFWRKLVKLPIAYFDVHHTGDTLQRINDNKQLQNFLTGTTLNTLFSFFNFIVLSFVLLSYNSQVFIIFLSGSGLYFLWIHIFMGVRRKLNYQTFYINSKENSATLEMVQGMQELRLNDAQHAKRWDWENIQAKLFKLTIRQLKYTQMQQAGGTFITQGKDALITFIVAKLVIDGKLTLGVMLSIQYILGQLGSPVEQFLSFIQGAQDAKISIERISEIHDRKDEEEANVTYINNLPDRKDIYINDLTFAYPKAGDEYILNNIHLHIPEGKVTSIVGLSGSGKTTLLKLMLKFYDNYEGNIKIGDTNLNYLGHSFWRNQCGAVFQDGYIFNDTIARNIALGSSAADMTRLIQCCKIANILTFIESLPNGFHTQIGLNGVGISQGQKQRILIARAIYKKPQYLFFDEATNSLDANNESTILTNLKQVFKGKTVVVVAHRLSTVKDSDKIVVLQDGRIMEEGTHSELYSAEGIYFNLVRNQLDLQGSEC